VVASGGGRAWAMWRFWDVSSSIRGAAFTIPDHEAPPLTLSAPNNGTTTTVPTVRITGTTEPKATISANGVAAVVASNGAFSFLLALAPGNNHVDVTATDPAGNPTVVSLNVTFKDPIPGLMGTLNETRAALAETQARLAVAQADLAAAQNNVTALQADLNATAAQLAMAEDALSDAQGRLTIAEANLTNALQRAIAAQVAVQVQTTNLMATTKALNDTQDDLVATNLALDKTQNDLEKSNANAVALSGQVAAVSILAAIALLAALAAIALFIVQTRRGERGGGGGDNAPREAADVVVPAGEVAEVSRGGQLGAPKKSFASKSAAGGELGSADGANGTAPGVAHASTKGRGGAATASLGSETSHGEVAAGTSEPPAED